MSEFRPTFASRFGVLMTMVGVSVGLGDVWRFPYMVGRYGGAAFVLVYVLIVSLIGVPALMAEWALGRHTRRGTVGAFERAGLPFGRLVGWFFFLVVTAATAYYTNVIGWVLYYALGQVADALGIGWSSAAILPPDHGFSARSFALQVVCTGVVILACAAALIKGLRSGIERASVVIVPAMFVILLILIARALTLPGAWAGVRWYILDVDLAGLTPRVLVTAMGQAIFSLSLGGTFMVVYGSYLDASSDLRSSAIWTATADTAAGLLAGLAIIPAVFALGLEPSSGPSLIFSTLPRVFAEIPLGWLFGLMFFLGLFGVAYLSDVAAFEVLVAGLTDNTGLERTAAVWLMSAVVFLFALPSMLNMQVFLPWDLTFGSGMQTLGALLAVVAIGWAADRSSVLRELASRSSGASPRWLYHWIRFVIPLAILAVGVWWLLYEARA